MSGEGKICKVEVGERRSWLETYNYYENLCIPAGKKKEGEDTQTWFQRQEKNLKSTLVQRAKESGPPAPKVTYFCFPGNAYLQKEDGELISFAEIAEMYKNNEELPAIASWNESTGEVVYQQPTKVIDHGLQDSALMYLGVKSLTDLQLKTLEVTPNHNLLVERNGEQNWIAAGQLENGDILLGPEGGYQFDPATTLTSKGVTELYNLSFQSKDTGLEPTYLISADGETWLIAHNIYK